MYPFYGPIAWGATHRLLRIYLRFGRVDTVMQNYLRSSKSWYCYARSVLWQTSMCCDTAQALVLMLVSLCCDTAQAKAGGNCLLCVGTIVKSATKASVATVRNTSHFKIYGITFQTLLWLEGHWNQCEQSELREFYWFVSDKTALSHFIPGQQGGRSIAGHNINSWYSVHFDTSQNPR